MNHSLLSHYAQAYFSLGKEKNRIPSFHQDMDFLSQVFQNEPSLLSFLSSPMVTKVQKDQLLEENIKPHIDIATYGFIQVMIQKKVIRCFDEVKQNFDHLYHEDQGILEGRIYTPFTLAKTTIKKLERLFSEKYKKSVVFRVLIDKKVIGGMRIYIDDTLYDYSLDSKLNQVRNKLLVQD